MHNYSLARANTEGGALPTEAACCEREIGKPDPEHAKQSVTDSCNHCRLVPTSPRGWQQQHLINREFPAPIAGPSRKCNGRLDDDMWVSCIRSFRRRT